MALTIEEIRDGIRANTIHEQALTPGDVPGWEGRLMTELSLIAFVEDIVWVQAMWRGDQAKGTAHVVAFTDSLMIESRIADSRGTDHETVVISRRSLVRWEISAEGDEGADGSPGRVRIRMLFDQRDGILSLPLAGYTSYRSGEILDLVPSLARDLRG